MVSSRSINSLIWALVAFGASRTWMIVWLRPPRSRLTPEVGMRVWRALYNRSAGGPLWGLKADIDCNQSKIIPLILGTPPRFSPKPRRARPLVSACREPAAGHIRAPKPNRPDD